VLRKEGLVVYADRGYFSGPEILACDELGMIPLVAKPLTSGNRCGFNRSMQHYKLLRQEECCDEKQASDLLH
jgi:hypothetical protein